MSDPIFTNLDAQFLFTLGSTFLADEDYETALRLHSAAKHLQSLDDKIQNAPKTAEYERGKRDAYLAVYSRSNLPPEDRSMPKEAYSILGLNVKKIPRGVSGLAPGESGSKWAKKKAAKAPPAKSSPLAGLKLDLSSLKL